MGFFRTCNRCTRRCCCGSFDFSCVCESPFCNRCRSCGFLINQGIITGN